MNLLYKKIIIFTSLLSMQFMHSTVEWSGTSCDNVINQDVIINGDCQLEPGITSILAIDANITINLNDDAVIAIATLTDPTVDQSHIQLYATYPYTITVIVNKKLTFKGAPGYKDRPLTVTVEGTGAVHWIIEEDGKLTFTADDNGGSAELWTYITNGGEIPSHTIVLHDQKQVHFGKRSKWGYMLDYCANIEAGTVIEHHHDTFMAFKDLSSFALEAY